MVGARVPCHYSARSARDLSNVISPTLLPTYLRAGSLARIFFSIPISLPVTYSLDFAKEDSHEPTIRPGKEIRTSCFSDRTTLIQKYKPPPVETVLRLQVSPVVSHTKSHWIEYRVVVCLSRKTCLGSRITSPSIYCWILTCKLGLQ